MVAEVFGPGTQIDITDEANRELGRVTVKNQLSIDTAGLATDTGQDSIITELQNILAQVDDATADTVLSVLKSLLSELQTQQKDALTDTELRASDVGVSDSTSHTKLDSILGQLDDATADTVIGVLKSLLSELQTQQKDALTDTQLRATDIEVNDDAAQTTLSSILTDLQGKRDGTGTEPTYTSSSLSYKIGAGQFFLMSSTLNIASGSEGTWSILNPSASGKTIYIVHVSVRTDNTDQVLFDLYRDSTITGGTALTPWNPNFNSSNTSIATVEHGESIRSGGTQLEASVAVSRDGPYQFEGLVVVTPGLSLQLTGVVPGALTAQDLTVGARWYEEPI